MEGKKSVVPLEVCAECSERVEIPKPDGGVRKLGIPTVTDRVIQQAIAQQLMPIYEPKFADGSYGYRPGRSAKDAILYANGGFDTRKSGKTAEKGAKIGLSEVKFNLDSPFFTVF